MDQIVIDATDLPQLDIGDSVTLLGSSGSETIGPQAWSDVCQSIPWEVLCSFKHRLPRRPAGRSTDRLGRPLERWLSG